MNFYLNGNTIYDLIILTDYNMNFYAVPTIASILTPKSISFNTLLWLT